MRMRIQYKHVAGHAMCMVTQAPTWPERANDQGPCPLCEVTYQEATELTLQRIASMEPLIVT